eukprot:4480520-Amphidinium_carterae.2
MKDNSPTPHLATNTWWSCGKCRKGWEWCRKPECRQCGAAAPPWVMKTFGAKYAAERPAIDGNKGSAAPRTCKPSQQGWQDANGYTKVQRRNRRKRQPRQPGATGSEQAPSSQAPNDAAMCVDEHDPSDTTERMQLQNKVKRMEDTLRFLGESGPPVAIAALVEAIDATKSQLRQVTPTARRLQSLQQGLDRREQKITKLGKKAAELHQAAAALGPSFAAAIHTLEQEYRAKQVTIEGELQQIAHQRSAAEAELMELQQEMVSLVPSTTSPAHTRHQSTVHSGDMAGFDKVTLALTAVCPDYAQVFQQVGQLAKEQFAQAQTAAAATSLPQPALTPPPKLSQPATPERGRQRGVGVYSTPERGPVPTEQAMSVQETQVDASQQEVPRLTVAQKWEAAKRAKGDRPKSRDSPCEEVEDTPVRSRSRGPAGAVEQRG